ncbi:Kelch repeat-containing protein [Maribacter halichondriae]|uniref:Kelch repeat-containing protein n=1 Tax=Maribacter halichondriae TaxID=2980554 RepID=UPI0023594608|nr:kelch repeat-containing protein [Maribacter sp. Hal144]
MKSKYILLIITVVTVLNCNKNDDTTTTELPELQNEPPLSFNLIDVADMATDVDVLPTLSWESAKNPKGGEVTYDLYLGKETDPTTLYKSDISGTSYEISKRLNLLANYYWKVRATDAEGRSSQSQVHKFTTRDLIIAEVPVVANASFPARLGQTTVAHEDKLWVIGGYDSSLSNDIWQSTDGLHWEQVAVDGHFSKRMNHVSVVFKDKIWVIGGQTGFETITKNSAHLANDVWYSENGSDWVQATSAAQFSARTRHTVTVFNDTLWLIGGITESGRKNDIWFSTDGINWTESTDNAPFTNRTGHSATVFDDKLWVIGGNDHTEEGADWYSEDGMTWTKSNSSEHFFSSRWSHTAVVFDDTLWVIGGLMPFGHIPPTMYSKDGEHWVQFEEDIPFLPRRGHTAVAFKNKLWVIAGLDMKEVPSVQTNDIWVLE